AAAGRGRSCRGARSECAEGARGRPRQSRRDVARALRQCRRDLCARAPCVRRAHFSDPRRLSRHGMPRRALSGQLTVFSSTQAPYMVRRALAGWMGVDESRIRVAAPHVGGGFGPKAGIYPEEFAVTLAARKLERPVKWVEDRREHFLATNQQRDEIWDVEAAADDSGRLLAV